MLDSRYLYHLLLIIFDNTDWLSDAQITEGQWPIPSFGSQTKIHHAADYSMMNQYQEDFSQRNNLAAQAEE